MTVQSAAAAPAPAPRRRQPLRRRLTLGLVALVLIVLIGAGFAMTLSVRSFLVRQLDRELVVAANGLAANENFDPVGLRDGTVVIETDASGLPVQPPVLIGPPGDRDGDSDGHDSGEQGEEDHREEGITGDDLDTLADVDSEPSSVELAELGDYRAVQVLDSQGHAITVALPLNQVNETLGRLLLIEGLTLAAAAVVVAVGGGWLIRRELLPLDRVARTAREVAVLPLGSGAPRLDQRVPEMDPGTEVGDVTSALNEMLDHLDASLTERAKTEHRLRQFVADASHELRTPLTSIKGYAELYRRSDVAEEDREVALRRIESEAGRMGTLVDDLLLLARLDQGRPLLHDPVDLCQITAETCQDFSVSAPEHPVSVDLPDVPLFVTGDADRLRQVLANLMSNAVLHTPTKTPIRVTVKDADGLVTLTVADSGPGMPADFQAHAFDRFSRADESRARASGGSGLGLSIVAAIVQALNGRVNLISNTSGTAVTVELPRSEPSPA